MATTSITLVDQGTLNRLLNSLVVPNFPNLNTSASYMGKRQITIAIEGNAITYVPTSTGGVVSPEPYRMVTISINLLKTQTLAGQWRNQEELSAAIGPVTVYLDSVQFPAYNFVNCGIQGVTELTGSGSDADYNVRVMGYYPINAALYS